MKQQTNNARWSVGGIIFKTRLKNPRFLGKIIKKKNNKKNLVPFIKSMNTCKMATSKNTR